jgi:hypothetical protein
MHSLEEVKKEHGTSEISHVASDRDTDLNFVSESPQLASANTIHAWQRQTESESVGFCTPTAQINHLLNEYQTHLHPFVIKWPEPPRCTLIHLNENSVSQDARSRNHEPIKFTAFVKGKERNEGLPSYTPRPGPFPAQIGSPPSVTYCAYEIHDDIEYNPHSPKLEDARIYEPVALQMSASHNARYGRAGPVIDTATGLQGSFVDKDDLHTSMSLPRMGFDHDHAESDLHPSAYPIQSAPAHVQSFDPAPQTGNDGCVGIEQVGKRSFSQETYTPKAFGNAPFLGTSYFGSSTFSDRTPRSPYGSLSFARSANGPTSTYQSSLVSPPPFTDHAAVRHPSYPPPPQEVVPQCASYGHSKTHFHGPSPWTFSNGPFEVNTDAMKESEILAMRAQSEQYRASSISSQSRSRWPTQNQLSRSSSVSLRGASLHPPPGTSSHDSSRTLIPGFSGARHGTLAPTFSTADEFTQSFEIVARGDPAREGNYRRWLEMRRDVQTTTELHGSSLVALNAIGSQDVPATHESRTQSLNFEGSQSSEARSYRHPRKYQANMRPNTQRNSRWNPNAGQSPQIYRPRNGREPPISGQFSPPKPRRKGQSAANVIDRYNRIGFVRGPTRGGYAYPRFYSSPQQDVQSSEEGTAPRFKMPTGSSLVTPSLFNEISQELTREYVRSQNSSPGRQPHAQGVERHTHSSRLMGPQMAANPGHQVQTPVQQDSGPNRALDMEPVTNLGSRFNVDVNALQGYNSPNATYRNGPTSTQPGLPGYRGHSRANSRLSDFLNGRNPSTQLSDYIKPDKTQNRQRSESKIPSSDGSAFSPNLSPAPSNFSDDFILGGDGSSKKKGKPKRKQPKRGAAKGADAVKTVSEQKNAKKDQQLANTRAARARRRSGSMVNDGKQNESGRIGENTKVKETETEEDVMMNEG